VKRLNRALSTFYTIDFAAAQSLDIEIMLNKVLETVLKALEIEAGSIYLREPNGDMTLYVYRGFSGEFVNNMQRIKSGEGVFDAVYAEKKPVVLDVSEYPANRFASFIIKEEFHILVIVPLISGGELIGILCMASHKVHAFPIGEIELLSAIGQQMSTTMRNVWLYERLQRELDEHKRAEEQIMQQREFLNNVFISLTHPFYVIDASNYTIVLANPAALLGDLTPGSKCYALTHGRDIPCSGEHTCTLDEVKRTKKSVVVEHIHRDKDGKPMIVEVHGYPIFDTEGNVAQMIEYCLDITEHKRAENEITFLASIVRNIPDAVCSIDLNGNIFSWNNGAEKMLGYKAEEIIGKPIIITIPEERAQKELDQFISILNTQGFFTDYESVRLTKDGRIIPVEITAAALKDQEQNITSYTSIIKDITERKQAEKEIEHLASFPQLNPDPVIEIDANGTFIYSNAATAEVLKTLEIEEDARIFLPGDFEEIMKALEQEKETQLFYREVQVKDRIFAGSIYVSKKLMVIRIYMHDITERKRAEEALRQSYKSQSVLNSLLRLALEDKTLEDILKVVLDRIFSITWLTVESKGSIFIVEDEPEILVMKTQTGLSEIIQKKCSRIPFGRCLCGRAAKTHEIQFADHLDDCHDVYDSIKPHGHYCIPILSAGRTLGVMNLYLKEGHRREQQEETFLIAVADMLAGIIQRKRSESALKDSEEHYHLLFESTPDCISHISLDGKFLSMNSAGCSLNALDRNDELIGESCTASIRVNREVAEDALRRAAAGETVSLEYMSVNRAGRDIWWDSKVTPIYGSNGRILSLMQISRDITERKQKNEELKEVELRYRILFEQSPDSVLIIDPETGLSLMFNDTACKQLGYSREEFSMMRISDYEEKETPEETKAHIEKILREGRDDFETKHRTRTGKIRDVLVTVQTIKLSGRNVFNVIYHDLTERKRVEELRIEKERLEFASIAKSEFLASMSHELRTPLNAIIGFSELLRMGLAGELSEKQNKYVSNISTSSHFLLNLINDILDMSKIEAGKIELNIEKTHIPITIEETTILIKENALKHNIHIIKEIDPCIEFIEADKQRLKQILFNLLSNAIKFRKEEGGKVTISVKKVEDMAQISVSDTGIGIKPENMKKLFLKFEQLEKGISQKYGGTGLGLSITKQLVELHGGKIWAESKYGEGSTFTFTIPIKEENKIYHPIR